MLLMEAAGDRITLQNDLVIAGAWTNAVLSRAEKMPKLEEMLAKRKPKSEKVELPDNVKNALLAAALQEFGMRVPKAQG
ncbi:hypothetical protein [Cereibacter changlensis]|uniref:hypothetical protein n=1 Tax=Cereibacter changlensis TaxID=402884 RepID=UPI004034E3A0